MTPTLTTFLSDFGNLDYANGYINGDPQSNTVMDGFYPPTPSASPTVADCGGWSSVTVSWSFSGFAPNGAGQFLSACQNTNAFIMCLCNGIPISQAPTTASPTTHSPTTHAPTTASPTTASPTTTVPTLQPTYPQVLYFATYATFQGNFLQGRTGTDRSAVNALCSASPSAKYCTGSAAAIMYLASDGCVYTTGGSCSAGISGASPVVGVYSGNSFGVVATFVFYVPDTSTYQNILEDSNNNPAIWTGFNSGVSGEDNLCTDETIGEGAEWNSNLNIFRGSYAATSGFLGYAGGSGAPEQSCNGAAAIGCICQGVV